MIASALSADIARFAARLEDDNPLYVAASKGLFTPRAARRYLVSVRHLVRQTIPNLDRARARALARGEHPLAEHFAAKGREEAGHDRWADADIAQIDRRFELANGDGIAPAITEMLRYLERVIDHDPRLYLSYILFSEQLIALRGDDWLTLLEERCGIPREMMSVVGNHAELDRQHVRDGLDAIDALVTDPAMNGPMRRTLADSFAFFERFCREVVGPERARCDVRATG